MIELGCGDDKQLLPPPGFKPHGVDISAGRPKRAEPASSAYDGGSVHASAIKGLAIFLDRYFTAGLLHSYHAHESEPVTMLSAMHRVL